MAQNGRNGTPAYKRIRGVIWKRIETGQLKPGDVVDSERELARIHQVSLMTARHALTSLEREGIVERRRGAGTFVAPPKIHFNKLMSYTEQMASRGLVACSRLLCIKLIEKEPEIAARLSLPPTARWSRWSACARRPTNPLPWKPATCRPKNSAAWSPPAWDAIPCSPPWNTITESNSLTPTKKSMPPPRTRGLRSSAPSRAVLPCCAFVRSSIRPREKRLSMCSAFTAPIDTLCSSAGSVLPDSRGGTSLSGGQSRLKA